MAVTLKDYERADCFLPWNLKQKIYQAEMKPHWTGRGSEFWFISDTREGKRYFHVIPENGTCELAFDYQSLVSTLREHLGDDLNENDVILVDLDWSEPGILHFRLGEVRWRCDLKSYACTQTGSVEPELPTREKLSPDGRHSIFARNHNLYLYRISNGEVVPITTEGQPYFDFGGYSETNLLTVTLRPYQDKFPPNALWSPDSRKILTQRLDQRAVKWLHLLQSCPLEGKRPVLHSFHFPLPGDENLSEYEVVILDIEKNTLIFSDLGPLVHNVMEPLGTNNVWWSEDSLKVYLIHFDRYFKKAMFFEIDAASSKSRLLLEESSQTFIEMTPINYGIPNVCMIQGGKEFLWYSERSGWGNLYRYDAETGKLLNPVAQGEFVVHRIMHVDETDQTVYFTAGGWEPGRDPYYPHLYRVGFDGNGLSLLTPENAFHEVVFSPDGRYFVDTYSRVDLAPVSVLRRTDGDFILKLQEADICELVEAGWKPPTAFVAKARDGETDLFGVIYRPTQLDENCDYPIIDSIYPGPQRIRTPKRFELDAAQALAELGFIVVVLDGMGTPMRSKTFHDICYRNFNEAGGLEDHITVIRQLAGRFPYMDIDRVGIYGHSAGGSASTKAMLLYPEFFKAAVSSAGNHDQRVNIARWGEKYGGPLSDAELEAQSNPALAERLQGKLMLVTGDMDDNVPPALTMQVVDALIKANRNFDLLILPNANHKMTAHPYFVRKLWDFFVTHLRAENPPENFRLTEENIPDLDIRALIRT